MKRAHRCAFIYSFRDDGISHSFFWMAAAAVDEEERVLRVRMVTARNALVATTADALENEMRREFVVRAREWLREFRAALAAYQEAGYTSDLIEEARAQLSRYSMTLTEVETLAAQHASDGHLKPALAPYLAQTQRDKRGLGI